MGTPGTPWSDDEVRAFVDGQLDAESAARFSAQVQRDLALAGRVARQRGLRRSAAAEGAARVSAAHSPAPHAASAATSPRPPPSALWWFTAAAALLLAAFIGWRVPRGTDAPLIADERGLMASGSLAQALTARISAEGSKAGGVLVSLSFRAGDGRYCRTFSLDTGIDGLACRSDAGWLIESIGRSPDAGPDLPISARQPSSELSPSVLAAISRWQAGNALAPEDERRMRDSGWQ